MLAGKKLSISERTCRTALDKRTESDILEQEKRGGRHRTEDDLTRERLINQKISEHIDQIPRVPAHEIRTDNFNHLPVVNGERQRCKYPECKGKRPNMMCEMFSVLMPK
nr:unnamed protein product [Callosobruchus chinensis]